jgi:peptidyl-prolyl cis-trans isomerase SurA
MIRPIVLALVVAGLANVSPICSAAYAAQAEAEVVDGVAAVVNGDVITYSQVRQLVGPREKLLRAQFQGEALVQKVKETRQAALNDLIDRQLIIQAFKKESFQIPDHYVEERVNDIIRTDFGGDRNTVHQDARGAKLYRGRIQKDGDG